MAKKFRCSTCGNIVTIDPTVEVLPCPRCGKKYRNIYYDPTATPRPVYDHEPAERRYYGPAESRDRELEERRYNEPQLVEDAVQAEEESEWGDEGYADEVDEEMIARKRAKLVAKRGAFIVLLLFGFALMAAVALYIYGTLIKGQDMVEYFKGVYELYKIKGIFKDDFLYTVVMSYLPYIAIALGVFILSAMHINVANLKLKALDSDADYSKRIASGKIAGYVFALIFAIVVLIYGGLVGIGGLALSFKKNGTGDVLQTLIDYLGTPVFINFVLGVIGTAYFAHRIDIAKK